MEVERLFACDLIWESKKILNGIQSRLNDVKMCEINVTKIDRTLIEMQTKNVKRR